ncbi:TPA: hypothetical protein DEW47_00675 [Patescibacteria group bacterium]|nr:hypothetical protein [Patescibacteria group bacterium]HCI04484.1 hypothetical protein [Patescibacteria group bacterium]
MLKIMHIISLPALRIIFKIFAGLEIYGRENLKNVKKPVIFSSNHGSYFDPPIISMSLTSFSKFHPIYYFSEDSLFKTTIGKLAKVWGAFPGKLNKGIDSGMRKTLELLWGGKSVIIFFEWCYKQEILARRVDKLIPLISKESMRPIVPVFLYGAENLSWKKIFKFQKKVMVFFGKPLYINGHLSEEEMIKVFYDSLGDARARMIEIVKKKEQKFWGNYSKFYNYLEKADPHKELVEDFKNSIGDVKGRWIDLGSGSGAIVNILNEKGASNNAEIIATDFEHNFIEELKNRFKEKNNIRVEFLDLGDQINFEKNSFDGVTANLVLPYIVCHNDALNLAAFKNVLKNIFEILKPGGGFVWSSPKKGVRFWKVFVASRKNIFDFKDKKNIYYSPMILNQALKIEKRGRRGVYHFLAKEEIDKILTEIGFVNITHKVSMAKQVNIIKCAKPI